MQEEEIIFYDQKDLVAMLKVVAPKKLSGKRPEHGGYHYGVYKHSFNSDGFTGKYQSFIFKDCVFTDCTFENIWGFFLYFQDCQFINCRFEKSRFSHGQFSWTGLEFTKCFFRNIEIDEGDLDNAWLNDCTLMNVVFLGETMFNVNFKDCNIENCQFQTVTYIEEGEIEEEARDVSFEKCQIGFSHFLTSDFRNSLFDNTDLYQCSFVDCVLANETFLISAPPKYPNSASIDFQTMFRSDISDPNILRTYFNIMVPDFKDYISKISMKTGYRTVFISYSFKDGEIAKAVQSVLDKHGAKCFLWEKDAPGGVYLEDIMERNVQDHETLLFISSQHSLKSKACQFELSQGRKKQEQTWGNIFFPIHIDNFLFEVKENQIRPIEKQKEYWENISELRRTNSKDFTAHNSGEINMKQLEKDVINHILKYLKTS